MYSLENGEQIRRFDNENGPNCSVVSPAMFVRRGSIVVTAGNNGLVHLWDAKNGTFDVLYHRHDGKFSSF